MARGLSTEPWRRMLQVYYLATPLFFLVDLVWRAPIRVAGIESPSWRYAYYAAIIGFVVLGRARPTQPVPPLFPPAKLWNFALAAPMVVISIKLSENALFAGLRRSSAAD